LQTLYIVGTPIGNLGDMSPRGIEILRSVKAIAAEDTRRTAKLLSHFGIRTRTISFREQNREKATQDILVLMKEGDVALVSDAGMPCISDPGGILVESARSVGFRVKVVPGPTAVASAVSLSGISASGYVFLGFLPRNRSEKMETLAKSSSAGLPLVVYEAPSRVAETLEAARDVFGDVKCIVAREMTKVYEEVLAGKISEMLAALSEEPLGEFVLIFNPVKTAENSVDMKSVKVEIANQLKNGRHAKEISQMISSVYGISGKVAYSLVQEEKEHLAK